MTGSAYVLNKAPQVLGVERCLAERLTTALKDHFVCVPNSHRYLLVLWKQPDVVTQLI